MTRGIWVFALVLALGLGLGACTDVDIFETPGVGGGQLDNKLKVKGEFCTEHPDELLFPVKIMFIIDCSQSMLISDPPPSANEYPGRVQAIWDVIQKYRFDPGVEFAIIRFEAAVNVATQEDTNGDQIADRFGFVNDLPALLRALNQLQAAGGNTSYQAALALAETTLAMDMSESSVDERARSKYVIIFLSDGLPYPVNYNTGTNTPSSILRAVREMMNLPKRFNVDDFTFHTAYLSTNTPMYVQEPAENLLRGMADEGDGTYRNFANGEEINFLDIDFTSIKRMYALKDGSFFVSNANANPAFSHLDSIDTDGDGLIDSLERSLGTDVGLRDTDGDGFNDLLEYNLRTSGFDPLDPDDADCSLALDRLDRDGDGLLDCEERFLGTSPDLFDTDGDGIPDPLEVRAGTNPVWADAHMDMDFDGSLNLNEVAWHTNPGFNDAALFSKLAYRYRFGRQPGIFESRVCYDFEVDNITLVGTEPRSLGEPAGYNDIMVYAGQVPLDDPFDYGTFRIACARVRYVPRYPEPDLKYPPSGELRFEQKHFKRPVATSCGSDADCPHFVCDPKMHVCQAPLGVDRCDENTPCPNFQCVEDRSGDRFCEYPVAVACLNDDDCPPYPIRSATGLCSDSASSAPLAGVCPKRECVSQYVACVDNTTCPGYDDTSPDTNPECLEGFCRQPCESAGQCNPGESCDPDPPSEYPPCGSNADCTDPSEVCRDGLCRRPCFSGADCSGGGQTCDDGLCTQHHCVDHSGGICALVACADEFDCPLMPCDEEVGRCLVQPCLDSRDCEHQHCELVLGFCMGPVCEEDPDCRGARGFTCNEVVGDPCDKDIDCPFDFCTVEIKRCAITGEECASNLDCPANLCNRMCDDPDLPGDQDPCCTMSSAQNPEFCSTDQDCAFNYCATVTVCSNDQSTTCTMSLDCPQNYCVPNAPDSYNGTCLNDSSIACDTRTANVEETCQVGMCSRDDNLGTCDTTLGEPCSAPADCPPYRCNLAVNRCYYPVEAICWGGPAGGCGPDYAQCPGCPDGLSCMDVDAGGWGLCGQSCNSDNDCPPALCKGRCIPQRLEDRMRCTDWFDADRDCLLFDSQHSGEVLPDPESDPTSP